MKTFIAGASGATGKLLTEHLLNAGQKVKVIVRPSANYPEQWNNNEQLTLIKSNIMYLSVAQISELVADCNSVACCLGHNMTFKGIYGKPRRLVTDSVKLLCRGIMKSSSVTPFKFVLMNTTGYKNKDLNETNSLGEKIIIGLLRVLVPPHPDNEQAAEYLRKKIGQENPNIEWVIVRPDSLFDDEKVTEYDLYKSHITSPIFKPGKTSRINVAHFMGSLLLDPKLWIAWKGQTPVIYNRSDTSLTNSENRLQS